MPEILTESFCERCGTRYTFESAAPRAAKLKGIKVLSRGLKNFVMSDDTSMDEAMAAARSETDREVTTQQLDAFHKTFNFCMTCRQYTCGNCWNEAEGRCLTCAPHLGHEILPAPFPDVDPMAGVALEPDAIGANGHAPVEEAAAMAWPTSDLMRDAEAEALATEPAAMDLDVEPIDEVDVAARLAALGGAAAVETVEEAAEPDVAAEAPDAGAFAHAVELSREPAGDLPPEDAPAQEAATAATTPVVPPVATPAPIPADDVDGRAAAASAQTADLFRRFRPGQNLDDEIAAYEREQEAATIAAAAAITPSAPEPDERPVSEPGLAAAAALGAAAATATPHEAPEQQGEPVTPAPVTPAPAAPAPAEPAAAESAPIAATSAPREDVVPQPTWQIVAPEGPGAAAPAGEPAAPAAEPQWPSQVEWPSQRPAAGLPFLGRPAGASGQLESLWAESAREVVSAPAKPASGVQPCVSCGLSLSATARFCRRCGTRQG